MFLKNIVPPAVLAAAVTIGAGAASQAATNIVTNPGFETGDLTGWSSFGWYAEPSYWGVTPPANGGAYFATTGCPTYYCTLQQTLPTIKGAVYALSFEFNPGEGVTTAGGDTQILWNGSLVLDVGLGPNAWTNYSVDGLVAAGADTLTFLAYQYPGFKGVDNVSVSLSSTGPNVGEGLLGFVVMSVLLIAIRYRGLIV